LTGLPGLVLAAAAFAMVTVALEFVAAGPHGHFAPYGLNAVVAAIAISLTVAALFVAPPARVTALTAMMALTTSAEIVTAAVNIGLALMQVEVGGVTLIGRSLATTIFAIRAIWWIGAMAAVFASYSPQPRLALLARAAALWVALIAADAVVPHLPVFMPPNFDLRNANWWEFVSAELVQRQGIGGNSAADFDRAQLDLLSAELAQLAPAQVGSATVYALGISGWSDDVFLKELDGGLAAIGTMLPIQGHTLRLVNHRETEETTPLANQYNFIAAVHQVGQRMNKDSDVLLLLMTSHGQPSGFGLRLPNDIKSELTPQLVTATLDREGIKNRIVIISACFSGTFVPPLANDDTIVLTASDAKNTSFGCAPERDWTYFGDAFFRQSVRPGIDLQQAFDHARTLIQGWEMLDRAKPSNPQGHFGPALVARLAAFAAGANQ
jgi:hypothetical protein